jgi:hypothetical protein
VAQANGGFAIRTTPLCSTTATLCNAQCVSSVCASSCSPIRLRMRDSTDGAPSAAAFIGGANKYKETSMVYNQGQ